MRLFRETCAPRIPARLPVAEQRTDDATLPADATPLRVDIATTVEGVRALRETWKRLAGTSRSATPFQDYGWVSAWARAFMEGENGLAPRIVVVGSGDRPLLLWPLQIDRHAGMRRLTWFSMPALQYGGVLMAEVPDALRQRLLEAAWRAIRRIPVDYVDLRLLPEHAPVARFLAERCRAGSRNHSFLVDLSQHADWRAYELSLSRSARRSRKKRLNQMRRAGTMRFRVCEDAENFTRLATVAMTWKREWLHAHGISGALPERREFLRFIHALGNRTAGQRDGSRWVAAELSLNGQPVAIDIGAVRNNRYHAFLSAYDADHARLSPGKVALWLMLRWCSENGLDAYDMLANAAPYKEDWATVRAPLCQFIHARTVGGLAYTLWSSRVRSFAMSCYHALPDRVRSLASGGVSAFRA